MDPFERNLALSKAKVLSHCTPENRASPFTPLPGDVVINGPAKSGTTWMQQIVHQLRTGGDETTKDLYVVVPVLPSHNVKVYRDLMAYQGSKPRAFKTHSLYDPIPKLEGDTRFIVIVRHPYDTEYSLMKFAWRYIGFDRDMTAEEYQKTKETFPFPDFGDIIVDWWQRRHDPKILFLTYESLKQDLAGWLQKINVFLYGHAIEEPTFSKVLHLCSWEYMSKHPEKFMPDTYLQQWCEDAKVEIKRGIIGMVRPDGGQVGQGKALLPETIKEYVDKRWKETVEEKLGFKNYQEMYEKWQSEVEDVKKTGV